MTINIMTEAQLKNAITRKKNGNNNVYEVFLRPIVEDGVPGISFSATEIGYASPQSAYKAIMQRAKGEFPYTMSPFVETWCMCTAPVFHLKRFSPFLCMMNLIMMRM